jgi:MFS family permease
MSSPHQLPITTEDHGPQSLKAAGVALAGLSAVFLFEMLDNSILNVALPTIGRELDASTTALQWVTGAYAVVFGGLMLLFSAIADRFGRRRVMLSGLTLLALASLATAFVTTPEQLIAVRAAMGVAAAMTTPGSMSLAFRLFDDDQLRVRALTLISTVGLVGLAIGPTVGGFVLAIAPWQVLLLINVPIAVLAFVGIRIGIGADLPAELHRVPLDITGALLGTATIVSALVAPTLFVNEGIGAWQPWTAVACAVIAAMLFVVRERRAQHPLLDLRLIALPLVSSGLAYKAASGLAISGLSYMVTLQLQFAWVGHPPSRRSACCRRSSCCSAADDSWGRSCRSSGWSVRHGSAPRRSFSGSPSSPWAVASATSGSPSPSCSSRRECAWSASSPAPTCSAACRRTAPRSALPSSTRRARWRRESGSP